MEIYLIRHTTPKIEKGICYGQSDIDVLSDFSKEVSKIKTTVTTENAEIYSSPLKRCATLANCFGAKIIFDDRLKEVNFGDWELQKWEDINTEELNKWMGNFVYETPSNGESYLQLSNRVNQVFEAIVTSSKKDKIIVTHGGVIRAIMAVLLSIDLKDSFEIKVPYSHVVKLIKDEKGIHIKEGLIMNNVSM